MMFLLPCSYTKVHSYILCTLVTKMGKIRMCNVFWFVLEYTIVFVSGETGLLDVTLCETSENAEVSCPENKTIALKSIVYGKFSCQNADNRAICHSNINTFFNDHCLGQNNCTLPVLDILSNNSCERSPKRVKVFFTCSGDWWRGSRHPSPVETCANTLTEVNCPSSYYIHFKRATIHSTTSNCDIINTDCASNRLKGLCNEKRSCISDETKTSCLYHKRFARIQYACQGPTDHPITYSIHSTSTDRELKTTTTAAGHVTAESEQLPELSFDKDNRVVIYLQSIHQTQHLCSSEWEDDDAAVLCRHFNSTWIGIATVVDTLVDIPIANYSLHCNGFETSLFKCIVTKNEKACNTTKVAGAMCCQGTDRLGQCVTNPLPRNESLIKSESLTLASIHVTIMSALIVSIVAALLIILIVCYRRSRSEKLKPCQSQHNSTTTEMTDSSDYNVINYSEMSHISMIKINEKRNEIPTIQHHLQNIKTSIKQNQNICTKNESLSTNQNSLEHIYESDSTRNNQCESLTKQRELDKHTYESAELLLPPDIKTSMEQDQNICHKYETLSTNRNSDKHIYESDSIHTDQYESLTKPPESDKHTYESTELTQPHDIEQDQHICIKYESLSTNRNSDKHIYESTPTNQYESLKKQQESDKHTYESTEHAQPHDIKISTDQEDHFCNKYESLSTHRNSVEHTYESTEQTLPVSQYQSLTNPQESDKHVYASTESPHYSA